MNGGNALRLPTLPQRGVGCQTIFQKRGFIQSGILVRLHSLSRHETRRELLLLSEAEHRTNFTKMTTNMLDYSSQRELFRILLAFLCFCLQMPGKCERPYRLEQLCNFLEDFILNHLYINVFVFGLVL